MQHLHNLLVLPSPQVLNPDLILLRLLYLPLNLFPQGPDGLVVCLNDLNLDQGLKSVALNLVHNLGPGDVIRDVHHVELLAGLNHAGLAADEARADLLVEAEANVEARQLVVSLKVVPSLLNRGEEGQDALVVGGSQGIHPL